MLNQESVKLNNLLNIEQVADLLGIKKSTVYSYTHYKTIPFVKIGRLVKFEVSKIQEWKDKMPSCDGKPLSDCGIRRIERKKQGFNSQQIVTTKPCNPSSDTNRKEVLMKGVYKTVNKSGTKYGMRFVDPSTGREKKQIVSASKDLAEKSLMDITLKIERKEFLGIEDKKPVKFADFVPRYIEYCRGNNSPLQAQHKESVIKRRFIPLFSNRKLTDIKSQEIEQYKLDRKNSGKVAPATINRELAVLKNLFTKAIEWGLAFDNPVKKIKFFKEPPGRLNYLTTSQMETLVNACVPHLKPIVITALNTGMRKGEILNLEWKDIDFANRKLIVQNSKNNAKRVLPINPTLYATLSDILRVGNKVFDSSNFRKSFDAAVLKSGLKGFRFHDLRHTFASFMAMSGCSLTALQTLMGHKDFKMTMRYSHFSEPYLDDAIAKIYKKQEQK
ncbi:MAG: tyrosine-type recombinase/integrase [bacterium]